MKDTAPPDVAARLAVRERPDGMPIMYQSWDKLLFMHWPIRTDALRHHIPERLHIDTFDGQAWIAITPFTVRDARPVFVPPLPWVSDFHETNVRTYVYIDGVPGVWFFSLDANSLVAVLGARAFFSLPYHEAEIQLEQKDQTIDYVASRKDAAAPAEFRATWTIGPDLPQAEPGSLEFFLVERYCLYTSSAGKLYRCRIHHRPWPLQQPQLSAYHSSIVEADGLPTPAGQPLLHAGGPVDVDVWPLEEI
ncbi:MAG TPA: DUF2071 domain-containing protein [Blastocatellia bacterium]|nr:DUF2071 domain-containing protein [Blastocatellia bacterium]